MLIQTLLLAIWMKIIKRWRLTEDSKKTWWNATNIEYFTNGFIDPRPGSAHNEEFLRECREKYTPNANDVKPGISGYAQIKMKREHDPEFKAEWDHKNVLRMSFWFDTKIFVYTILKLFGAAKGRWIEKLLFPHFVLGLVMDLYFKHMLFVCF